MEPVDFQERRERGSRREEKRAGQPGVSQVQPGGPPEPARTINVRQVPVSQLLTRGWLQNEGRSRATGQKLCCPQCLMFIRVHGPTPKRHRSILRPSHRAHTHTHTHITQPTPCARLTDPPIRPMPLSGCLFAWRRNAMPFHARLRTVRITPRLSRQQNLLIVDYYLTDGGSHEPELAATSCGTLTHCMATTCWQCQFALGDTPSTTDTDIGRLHLDSSKLSNDGGLDSSLFIASKTPIDTARHQPNSLCCTPYGGLLFVHLAYQTA